MTPQKCVCYGRNMWRLKMLTADSLTADGTSLTVRGIDTRRRYIINELVTSPTFSFLLKTTTQRTACTFRDCVGSECGCSL